MAASVSQINKFLRTYVLTIVGANGSSIEIGDASGNSDLLSLSFSVELQPYAMSTYSSFKIKNLNETHRRSIYRQGVLPNIKPRSLKLQAGYVGYPLDTIFDGSYMQACSYREEGSTDWITAIEGSQISLALGCSSYTTKSFANPSGIKTIDVINTLFGDLKNSAKDSGVTLSVGYISPNYSSATIPLSATLDGWTWELMQTYTDKTCYISNNKFYALLNNEAFSTGYSLISSETGLVGSPKIEWPFVVVEMIFEPSLVIGQGVYLQTQSVIGDVNLDSFYNGLYKVIGVKHSGTISSSEGGKCRTIVKLRSCASILKAELNGPIPSPNKQYGL